MRFRHGVTIQHVVWFFVLLALGVLLHLKFSDEKDYWPSVSPVSKAAFAAAGTTLIRVFVPSGKDNWIWAFAWLGVIATAFFFMALVYPEVAGRNGELFLELLGASIAYLTFAIGLCPRPRSE